MIVFEEVVDDDSALVHSPMVRAMEKTFAYIYEHGAIPLTPSKAFKRSFVHWAAAEFEWPGYLEADLFAINKVLNEIDFGPLMDLHDLMIALKIGRHSKGQFTLTKAGQSLVGHPGRLFGIITPFYLFEVDHLRFARRPERLPGNWDIFLNVLNVEVENGATATELRHTLYGPKGESERFDMILSNLYVQVLRPLCWTGLLREDRVEGARRFDDGLFTKTSLWRTALRLDTDRDVRPATHH